MASFRIANRVINSKEPVYFVAEIGLNHNGNMQLARNMIHAAGRSGAEAVKFQTYRSERLADPDKNPELYRIFKLSELSEDNHKQLKQLCDEKGLAFISTPFDEESVDLLASCGVDALKVASSDLTNYPLLRKIASYNLPVIISTGMGYMDEVRDAIFVLKKAGCEFILPLHCVSNYPPEDSEMNLLSIVTMRKALGMDVGYSDHFIGELASLTAITLGALLIEKHFTTSKNLSGPDQRLSADEGEFHTLVEKARRLETMLGDGVKKPSAKEKKSRSSGRQGVYAAKDIAPGETITQTHIFTARPEGEIPASEVDRLIGTVARNSIKAGSPMSFKYVKSASRVKTQAGTEHIG
jgi:N,N'-diacetyllegionaminate synthase